MKKYLLCLLSAIGLCACNGLERPVDYVDCFIGTSNSRWMLGPYAQRPFGMVQLGPDNQGDVWMGGYEYSNNSISGFSHIHAWTMGGLRFMPTTLDLATSNPRIMPTTTIVRVFWRNRLDGWRMPIFCCGVRPVIKTYFIRKRNMYAGAEPTEPGWNR